MLAGNAAVTSTPPPTLPCDKILAAVTPTPRQFRTRIGAFTDVRFDVAKASSGAPAAPAHGSDSLTRAAATCQALSALQFAPVVRSAVRSIGCRVVGFADEKIAPPVVAAAVARPGVAGWDDSSRKGAASVLQDMVSVGDVVVAIDGEDVHFRFVLA